MSVSIRLRGDGVGRFAAAAAMCLAACGPPQPGAGSGGPVAVSTAKPVSVGLKVAARPEHSLLEEKEVRVALVIVPGDALVEVDGQAAYRRDGAIDLTGRVGDKHQVRVWKRGMRPLEEEVTIQEQEPSPPRLELKDAPSPKPGAKGPSRPASFPLP